MSGLVSVPNLFAAVTTASTPNLDGNFAALVAAFNNPLTYAVYSTDSGAANAYVGTLAPAPANQAALLGCTIAFTPSAANTGSSTLNLNGLGAQSIVRSSGGAVQAGDLVGTVILVWNGTNYVLQTFAGLLPLYYIAGFTLTNNGTTGMDVAAGQAMDSTNATAINGTAIANKTQSAWAAGAAAGGKLSAAAMANNTWYYWYALWKTADSTVDYGFDVSASSPTLPSGYSKYRYIGARKTQAASTNWDTFIQHGDEVRWSTPPALDLSASTVASASRTLQTVNVPAVRVEWLGAHANQEPTGTANGLIFTDPACADVTVNAALAANISDLLVSNTTPTTLIVSAQVRCWTNTSSQIGIRSSNAGVGSFSIQTRGWIDPRGKPVL